MAEIEIYATPPTLYRYRPLADDDLIEREIKAIVDGNIYCARFDQMNDPMEGMHRESYMFRTASDYKTKRTAVENAKNEFGIASLTEVFDHEPMWAHYADNFRGICIGYRFSRLLALLPANVEFVRMAYNEEAPTLVKGGKTAKQMAKLSLSSKTARWMSEREWRIIQPKPGFAEYGDPSCVRGVYTGARMSEDILRHVRREMGKLNIPVHRMTVDEYEIAFEKLDRLRPARKLVLKKAKPSVKAKTATSKRAA